MPRDRPLDSGLLLDSVLHASHCDCALLAHLGSASEFHRHSLWIRMWLNRRESVRSEPAPHAEAPSPIAGVVNFISFRLPAVDLLGHSDRASPAARL